MSSTNGPRDLRSSLAPGRAGRHPRRRSLRAAAYRLRLEPLEDRRTPGFSPAVSYPAGASPTRPTDGEAGSDWFFARKSGNKKDKVNDLGTGEVVTAIS